MTVVYAMTRIRFVCVILDTIASVLACSGQASGFHRIQIVHGRRAQVTRRSGVLVLRGVHSMHTFSLGR